MSNPDEYQHVNSPVGGGDHLSATTTRKGKIVGFGESHGRGRAASGDADADGMVSVGVAGTSPKGEEGTLYTCQRLIDRLALLGQCWSDLSEVSGLRDIDAIATGCGDGVGQRLQIQVVRALTSQEFWRTLGRDGESSISVSIEDASGILKRAIEVKVAKRYRMRSEGTWSWL